MQCRRRCNASVTNLGSLVHHDPHVHAGLMRMSLNRETWSHKTRDKSPGNYRRYVSVNTSKVNRKQSIFFKEVMIFGPQIRQQS